jgi:hypothetical protein
VLSYIIRMELTQETMKSSRFFVPLAITLLLLVLPNRSTQAATFTSDTTIGVSDTNYDGQDIIVINCTLTVDGTHSFSDILVVDNGVLTHSYAPYGLATNVTQVVGELQTLTGTNYSTLDGSGVVNLATIVVTGATNGVTYVAGTDYSVSSNAYGGGLISRLPGSAIPDGAAVAVSYVWISFTNTGVNIVVSNNVVIEEGSAINVDGRGEAGLNGPGAGAYVTNTSPFYSFSGSGGGYGGRGGSSLGGAPGGANYLFGPMTNFAYPGFGGGAGNSGGSAGGGAVNLIVGGALELDGVMTANGASGSTQGAGGGSGGGILLRLGDFAGGGSISANGGSGETGYGGGGGGGNVFVSAGVNEFTGNISAHGGPGFVAGGAGTIYTVLGTNGSAQLILDNGGLSGTNTPFAVQNAPYPDVIITNGAIGLVVGSSEFYNNLLICSNSALTTVPNVELEVTAQNVTIAPGGAILLDGIQTVVYGGGAGETIVSNNFVSGGGGGHGGYGAASAFGAPGGLAYDYPLTPTGLGSVGGTGNGTSPYNQGGFGGGAFKMTVSETLLLNGLISANGTTGIGEGSGGGSGGAVWISASTISGGGTVSARGGAGQAPYGGGGGGGCIAIYSSSNSFPGSLLASGGGGANRGGAGTVYTHGGRDAIPQLIVDNGGGVGTNTPLPAASGYDLTVSGGAVASVPTNEISFVYSLHNLLIASNSTFTLSAPSVQPLQVTLSGSGIIQVGGRFVFDGLGYLGGQGPGAGSSFVINGLTAGGGAGHGGFGGFGGTPGLNQFPTGLAYDVLNNPTQAGSGGGRGINNNSGAGGPGGGNLQLRVNGSLLVAGNITANGSAGTVEESGGGSGGAINLTAGSLSGNGSITANGGGGAPSFGGGGAGGRIGIYTPSNNFTGTLAAYGGPGNGAGGAGTIYVQNTANQSALVLVDNGGLAGTNTPLPVIPATYDLMITNGAALTAVSGLISAIRNLTIAANSFLVSSGIVTVLSNAVVQAGGGIVLDGKGYAGGVGPGHGFTLFTNGVSTGGGGGHGGVGGSSAMGAAGGTNYDYIFQPQLWGSGGGAGQSQGPGGAGGGTLIMRVTGTLLLNGSISANGLAGVGQASGGGAGGTIQLSVGQLTGSGSITAIGGAGEPTMGGGGGAGGFISLGLSEFQIRPATNPSFTGTISAHGGPGFVAGGAGIIYRALSFPASAPQVVLDNGGLSGATTPFVTAEVPDVFITGNARVMCPFPQFTEQVHSLLIGTNSVLGLRVSSLPQTLQLTVRSNVTVQAGGAIILDGEGYSADSGPGAGKSAQSIYGPVGSGGGHGGNGGSAPGVAGGAAYDSVIAASSAGSGGGSAYPSNPGGAGGGYINILVNGTLQVDGVISANGTAPFDEGSGGGSGGSIALSVGVFTGGGLISANGGGGSLPFGGGGGGGRITISGTTNQFSGNLSAVGGTGFVGGGAGTILTQFGITRPGLRGTLIVDNGGLNGTNTPVSTEINSPDGPGPFATTVSGGAQVQPLSGQPMSFSSLRIGSGSALILAGTSGSLNVMVTGDALVDTNALISADGQGYNGAAANAGPGAGTMLSTGSGSGAGYGGAGGASSSGVPGGVTYGSSLMPTNWGSHGGVYSEILPVGAGGGAVVLQVGGALTVNGTVTANGNAALFEGAGGGSGGSVFLTAHSFAGIGTVTANGGSGELSGGGGGGGGGRIAVYSPSNTFSGFMAALGGPGAFAGQTGTVFLSANISPLQIISGAVLDVTGLPVANVSLQPSGGLPATMTDSNGNYSMPISVGWSGTVTPLYPGGVFVPGSLSYSQMNLPLAPQNYLFVPATSLNVTSAPQSTGMGLTLTWFGASGVPYQVMCSTNLLDWTSYATVTGTGSPIQFQIPYSAPQMFFRIGVVQQ